MRLAQGFSKSGGLGVLGCAIVNQAPDRQLPVLAVRAVKSGSPMFRKIIGSPSSVWAQARARAMAEAALATLHHVERFDASRARLDIFMGGLCRASRSASTSAARSFGARHMSSTALTYLCPSVPPNSLASSTAFVEGHPPGHVGAMQEFVRANPHDAACSMGEISTSSCDPARRRIRASSVRRPVRCSHAAKRRSEPRSALVESPPDRG
jgi:hypothetical protein